MKSIFLGMVLLLPMTYFSARAQTAFPTANGSIAQGVANLCVNSSGVAAPCPSATAPGTSSTAAQPIQGVTGGVPVPVSGTFSASFSGFSAATTGTPIAATTSAVTGTLPSGAVVVATNVGGTNGAYCALGASASTSSQYIPPGGGWFAFTVGSATQLTCITSSSTTTVNLTGGAGLPTGAGGTGSGGGGGGGGNVNLTQLNTVNLGSPSNYGTSPGAVEVQGVNAYVTNTVPENLSQVGGATVNLGQTTMSGSIPVVLPSNQSSIPVTGTFFQSTQPVSISGNQGVNLAQVNGTTVNLGQTTMSASVPVAIASNQGSIPVTGTFFQSTQPVSISGSQSVNEAQVAGTALGAPSTYGTSPGAVTVPGVNAYVTNTVPVTGTFFQATQPVSQATASSLNATVVGAGTAGTPTGGVVSMQGVSGGTAVPVTGSFYQATQPVSITGNQAVNTAQVNGVTTLTGAGATGTGSQRETVAQDTTTIAGSAPGTAGTASANVVSVQGESGMTPIQVSQTTASNLNAAVVGTGTAGTPAGGVLTVQGNASGTPIPVSGTFSASIAGFTAAATGSPISATTSGVTGTLPTGAVVVATNIGSTNGAYCQLGASASTSSQYIAPGGGWFAFTVGSATQLTCITSTGTTTVNLTGGAGLPTGAGGAVAGTGGGGNSNITQWNSVNLGSPSNYGTSPGAVAVPGVNAYVTNTVPVTGTFYQSTQPVSIAGSQSVNEAQLAGTALGAPSTYGTSPGAVAVAGVNAYVTNTVPVTGTFFQATQPVSQSTAANLNATVVGAGTAGTPSGGVVSIQGVSGGTSIPVTVSGTQSVNTAQVNGVTTLTGAGATGTGSQRETVAQDTTTIAGSAPGTAGTASANVVTVQGVTSMTPIQIAQSTASSLNAAVVGTGTAGAPSGGVLTVQGSGSGTALPVSLSGTQSVNTAQVNGVTTLTGAGATGTGSQRETVAQDTTTIAGSAPGTAGTASSNVLTVQGVTGMTPVQVSEQTPAAAPTVSASNAVTSLVLKASATSGGVKYFHAENATTTGGYCILYNGTAAPTAGALTASNVLLFQYLPPNGYCDWSASNFPVAASSGAVLLVSSATTPFTYTTGTVTAAIYGLAQ